MSFSVIVLISFTYLVLLFMIAYYFRNNSKLTNNAITYALSLAVYCTAWTFYGSIGKSAESGLGFLGVYLGPTLLAPLWILILKKIIKISKYLRITSSADFISSRYGKNTTLGVIVSCLCLFTIIPYISIQYKALEFSFILLNDQPDLIATYSNASFYNDPVFYFGFVCALFAIFFGTIKGDPSRRHPGIMNVVAIESIIKLIAFLIGAIVIIYGINNGIDSIFETYNQHNNIQDFFDPSDLIDDGNSWFWVTFISAFAFLFLPRQFHMAVVENTNLKHVNTASWFTPLYLFLTSALVIPVALAGKNILDLNFAADTYLLSVPMQQGWTNTVAIVFIGGLAASTGMVITSLISMSIMASNNIFLPILVRINKRSIIDVEGRLLVLRRLFILSIFILSYGFLKYFTSNFSLVSVGLISFAGIAQLIPAVFLGMYWKHANAKGITAGLISGILIWVFTLPFANLSELGFFDRSILEEGLFGISLLKPTALFDIQGWSAITHSCIWSLSTNFFITVSVSIYSSKSAIEIAQTDVFLNPDKYIEEGNTTSFLEREASFSEMKKVLSEILGAKKMDRILTKYARNHQIESYGEYADSSLINHLENLLSGTIGTASSRVIFENIVRNKPVKNDQLFEVLDKTNQLYEYSTELEKKSSELKIKSDELSKANNRLLELDQMKNEFISNVTHELRTPLTSIRSLANSLASYDLPEEDRKKIIQIIENESERVSELVNQVLELRRLEVKSVLEISTFDLGELTQNVILSLKDLSSSRTINVNESRILVTTDKSKLKQVILNLLNNAIKFTSDDGTINIKIAKTTSTIRLDIEDNGIGISKEDLNNIFDRFYQVKNEKRVKSEGSGLGLSICKSLVELLNGKIEVESILNEGTSFSIEIENFIAIEE